MVGTHAVLVAHALRLFPGARIVSERRNPAWLPYFHFLERAQSVSEKVSYEAWKTEIFRLLKERWGHLSWGERLLNAVRCCECALSEDGNPDGFWSRMLDELRAM